MIDIKPSDIRGPLSRYQATKFEKDDFYQLICSINKTLEVPLDDNILKNAFEAMWTTMETEVNNVTKQFALSNRQKKGIGLEQQENAPIEEILQLLRKQNSVLSSPENLLPIEYMEHIQSRIFERKRELYVEDDMLGEEVIEYFRMMISRIQMFPLVMSPELIEVLNLEELMNIFKRYARGKNTEHVYVQLRDLERELQKCIFKQKRGLRIVLTEPDIENTVETYADVVNLILVLLKNKNLQTKLFAFQNEGVAFWGFLDATLHKFFIDWIKIKKLYDEKVIDENMYHPWIAGKLTELNVPIKKSSARYLNHLIEQLACEIDGCTDDKDE